MAVEVNGQLVLTERELSEALRTEGHKISAATLATFKSRKCGPPYIRVGSATLYPRSSAIEWAKARAAAAKRSEFDAQTAARSIVP
jgi:hypothetical protein